MIFYQKLVMKKYCGKPVGNDKAKKKCTYVTKFGLERAQRILTEKTEEAVQIAEEYGPKGEFLKSLARIYYGSKLLSK